MTVGLGKLEVEVELLTDIVEFTLESVVEVSSLFSFESEFEIVVSSVFDVSSPSLEVELSSLEVELSSLP